MIMLRLLPSGKLVVVVLLASEPLPEAAAPLLAAGLEVLPPPQEARVPRMRRCSSQLQEVFPIFHCGILLILFVAFGFLFYFYMCRHPPAKREAHIKTE